jgi:hypothetical protein
MVLGRVHVFPEQLGRIIESKHVRRRLVAENAGAYAVAAEDGFSSGSEYQVDSLFAFAQRKFSRLMVGDIVRRDKVGRAACPIDTLAADLHFDQSSILPPASADLRMIEKCRTFR